VKRLAGVFGLVLVALTGCGGGGSDGGSPSSSDGATKSPPVLGRPAEAEDAARALGFPAFATKNTTRVGGADPVADAAGVARAVFPSVSRGTRPGAVTLVDVEDWRSAISAAQLMSRPLRAPVLFADGDELPAATTEALEALDPVGADKAAKAQVIRIGSVPAPDGLRATAVNGTGHVELAAAIDRLAAAAAGKPSAAVLVASSDAPAYAMPAAGLAAKDGLPVLWVTKDAVPAATRRAIETREQPRIYVVGPEEAVSKKVLDELGELGAVRRVSGTDPIRNAVAFARFADGSFGWNVVDPGHGLVFASAERTADAAAGAALSAAGSYGPLLLVQDAGALPAAVESYLLDIQPGYDRDPVRGVYNHGWLLGDEEAISVTVQGRIDSLLEIQPVSR
jgi:hypothetical protein